MGSTGRFRMPENPKGVLAPNYRFRLKAEIGKETELEVKVSARGSNNRREG